MKSCLLPLALTLIAQGSAHCATIQLTNVTPSTATASPTSTVSGVSDNGTLSTISPSSIAVMSDSGLLSTLDAGTYGVRVSGITVGADVHLILQFDLTVTASSGDGILIRRGAGRGWAVDQGKNGAVEARFLSAGESISFSVSNMTLTGGTQSYDIAFNGFSNGTYIVDGSGTATFTPGIVGLMTGTTGTGYVGGLNMSFGIIAVPEPSFPVMGGVGALLLFLRRRRTDRMA
ncbi:hypothetical protein KBB96_03370 [Luteolibacter ambystomatis]|uniref:PEP-CTERM sorting domain-containing protein n=1 Tax=Luteolibacter ambystomatis TaxID=2824561 RepID=A0A975J0T5_9BACT|nr:hypothetical protein [Luteolibacter ambystomatis]QUE51935.1 hypothetical protein KBB96_03370 [Luteolibacter ambystomatis]